MANYSDADIERLRRIDIFTKPGDRETAHAIHNQARLRSHPIDAIQVEHLLSMGYRAGYAKALSDIAAAGRLLPEGARAHGICGEPAPSIFAAALDLQVCELIAGHKGWHGRPNGPGEPWMHWTEDMAIREPSDG